jgi:hypothetical protein
MAVARLKEAAQHIILPHLRERNQVVPVVSAHKRPESCDSAALNQLWRSTAVLYLGFESRG